LMATEPIYVVSALIHAHERPELFMPALPAGDVEACPTGS
jgi:hypothetical protein